MLGLGAQHHNPLLDLPQDLGIRHTLYLNPDPHLARFCGDGDRRHPAVNARGLPGLFPFNSGRLATLS